MRLVQTGEEGIDGITPYKVELDGIYTVGELIAEILAARPGEWGTITVWCGSMKESVDYRGGKADRPVPESVGAMRAMGISASGGWLRMDYDISVSEPAIDGGLAMGHILPAFRSDGTGIMRPGGIDWEQRTYETASRIMVAMVSSTERSLGFRAVAEMAKEKGLKTDAGCDVTEIELMAASSIEHARALIAVLRSQGTDNDEP
ncbi:hypothetical protein [uncultured Duncaniella sp.]|uniref:hypothetical protein n=1 Tax=uncultured Duncaniella sp. TaxID=2768039 RepID=UPI0025B02067|nr:hypothetical protein [uncultured Duncaniella sp.]